jgi:hypothetical protein
MIPTRKKSGEVRIKHREYHCLTCDYFTFRISDYNKHIITAKHKNLTNPNEKKIIKTKEPCICICGKKYADRSGLWKHKKTCTQLNEVENTKKSEETDYKEMVIEAIDLLKKQSEQLNKIIPLLEKTIS